MREKQRVAGKTKLRREDMQMSGKETWDWEAREKTLADLRALSEKFSACHEPVVSQDGEKIALPVQNEEDA